MTAAPAAFAERAAEHVDVNGTEVPAHFGDPAAEYRAAREEVALAHRPGRALFRVEGTDRATFLQGLLTADVAALQPGGGCRSLFLDNKGHVRGVLELWAGDDAIVVGCEASFIERALPDLTKYILAADVTVTDQRDDKTVLALLGPGVDGLLDQAGAQPPAPAPWAHRSVELGGATVWLARTADVGIAAIEAHVPAADVDAVWSALALAASEPPALVGWEAAELLRIEAGVPRIGHEINDAEFPQELRLDDAVDYEKGCYLGQETVARIHYRGQVNRLLSGLRGGAPLPVGAELVSSDREVGRITSAARSPRLGAIGLALVRREEAEAGATVQVRADGTTITEARVTRLPIED